MNNKRLILCTRRFPYFTTEAFIENEIEHLSKAFEEVIIIPSEISIKKRNLPDNVRVNNELARVFQNKTLRTVKTIFSISLWKAFFEHKEKISSKSDIYLVFKFISAYIVYLDFFKSFSFKENDVIYTYWLSAPTYALGTLKKSKNFKLISRAHRYDLYENIPTTPKFWPYRKETINFLDKLYPISNDGKLFLEKNYRQQCIDKNIVSRLGVIDYGKLSSKSNEGILSVVSVSRLHKMKRVDLILQALIAFSKHRNDLTVNWTHFGDGETLPIIQSILEKNTQSNLQVCFKGNVPNSTVHSFFSSCPVDLFINLSSSEGIPVSIMEAISYGIPVVATDVGGNSEVVNSHTGVLIDSNPSLDLIEKSINSILNNSDKLSPMKVKAFFLQNYNSETNYKDFTNKLISLK